MRRALPLLLALVAIAAAVGAAFTSSDPARAGAVASRRADTVLSARRAPQLLVAGAADPVLRAALDRVVAQSPAQTCLSVEVDGRPVYSHQAGLALAPASNIKLLTSTAALEVLGPDFRFRTRVVAPGVAGGTVKDQTVHGDLVLVGGGDPVLATKAFAAHFADQPAVTTSLESLADKVVASGVRHVTGRVLGDESRYDQVRTVPAWPPRYYEQHQTGPLSALSVDQGLTRFPAKATEENRLDVDVAPDPAAFAAATFADLLRQRGVVIDGGSASGTAAQGDGELASIESPPLADIVRQMLSTSDNQTAESIVKELGVAKGGAGTTGAGLGVVRQVFAGLSLPTAGLELHDGSGLDRDDRASCALISSVLDEAGASSPINAGLAVAGVSGTLRDRFNSSPAKGRLRAKTGTLNDVTALSGFASAPGGAVLTFSYIADGATYGPRLLAVQDDLAASLVGWASDLDVAALAPRPPG